MQIVGAGLCVVGAGAGAVTMPAVMAALGIKLAVTNGTSLVLLIGSCANILS